MECNHTVFLSRQVTKLLGMKSFNLPAKRSCPHMTEQCKLSCYADKGRMRMPNVLSKYNDNFRVARCECFVPKMLDKITYTDKVIRIHASGDFFSRKYFKKWLQIVKAKPWVTFYAYTRNWSLDLSNLPDNLIVYYSTDKTTVKENPTAERFARLIDGDKKKIKHLTPYKGGVICNSDLCATCGHCFMDTRDVYFLQKYKKYVNKDEQYIDMESLEKSMLKRLV